MQKNHKSYKKLFALGFVFLLVAVPLLILLKIETRELFYHLNDLSSDEGIVCSLFIIGSVLICLGTIFKIFTTT